MQLSEFTYIFLTLCIPFLYYIVRSTSPKKGFSMLFAAIIALWISNSVFSDLYFSTLEKYVFLGINQFGLKLSVIHLINNALMAIFFFLCYFGNKKRIFTR